MISALPGLTTLKPGSAQTPIPGIKVDILSDDGTRVDPPQGGLLVVSEPWPSMLRGIWGDPERFKETYWSRFSPQGRRLEVLRRRRRARRRRRRHRAARPGG